MLCSLLRPRLLQVVVGHQHQVGQHVHVRVPEVGEGDQVHGARMRARQLLSDWRPEDVLLRPQAQPLLLVDTWHKDNVEDKEEKKKKKKKKEEEEEEGKRLPDEHTLSRTADWLCDMLMHSLHLFPIDLSLLRSDIVLVNRLAELETSGIKNYRQHMTLYALAAQTRFSLVKCQIDALHKDVSEGVVEIDWRVVGVGHIRTALHYFSLPLMRGERRRAASLLDGAEVWQMGVSTFNVDNEGKVFRHVIDNKRVDRDRSHQDEEVNLVKRIERRLKQKLDQQPLPTS